MEVNKIVDGKRGGYLGGDRSHAKGGIPAINVDSGQLLEVESKEIIINKKSSQMFCEELSRMNQAGGGVAIPCKKEVVDCENCEFKDGGSVPNRIGHKNNLTIKIDAKLDYERPNSSTTDSKGISRQTTSVGKNIGRDNNRRNGNHDLTHELAQAVQFTEALGRGNNVFPDYERVSNLRKSEHGAENNVSKNDSGLDKQVGRSKLPIFSGELEAMDAEMRFALTESERKNLPPFDWYIQGDDEVLVAYERKLEFKQGGKLKENMDKKSLSEDLSCDHKEALEFCNKKGLANKDIVKFWSKALHHFKEEENEAFPEMLKKYPKSKKEISGLLDTHNEFYDMIKVIKDKDSVNLSGEFCDMLKAHIRIEDKVFEKYPIEENKVSSDWINGYYIKHREGVIICYNKNPKHNETYKQAVSLSIVLKELYNVSIDLFKFTNNEYINGGFKKIDTKDILNYCEHYGNKTPIYVFTQDKFIGKYLIDDLTKSKFMVGGAVGSIKKVKSNPLTAILEVKELDLVNFKLEYKKISETFAEKEITLKSEIDKYAFEYDNVLYAGLSENNKIKALTLCAKTMPDELVHTINRLFKEVNKSPYSCSVYSGEKDWGYTELNSYSVSDHWNFYSRGQYHKLTTTPIKEAVLSKYNDIDNDSFYADGYWTLAQFVEGAKSYDSNMNDLASEPKGCYVIIDVFKADYDKANALNDLSKKRDDTWQKLREITPDAIIYKISNLEKEVNLYKWLIENNYTSFEDYEKKIKKELKAKLEVTKASLVEKLNKGLVTGSVTKKNWGGSVGRFKLIGETISSGIVTDKTATTITVKTDKGDYVTGKDYVINTSELAENERDLFYEYSICDESASLITGLSQHKVCLKTKFKM